MDSGRVEHLKMIQAVVTRMGQNSFNLKGWTVTLLAALLGLAAANANTRFAIVAFVPVIIFWLLDAYYLRQERLFRKLYDEVRGGAGPSDFSMNTSTRADQVDPLSQVALSKTLGLFYGAALLVTVLATFLI